MPEAEGTLHEEHFDSLERQKHAVRLGMWVFMAAETLLFAALFALYATERYEHLEGFEEGVRHNLTAGGTLMTVVLLASSFSIAWAVHELRHGRGALAGWLATATALLGAGFLGMKMYEYADHVAHGIVPGGHSPFFARHGGRGLVAFFNLYWLMTGLHFIHVIVGVMLLFLLASWVFRSRIGSEKSHVLETGALYWHMVDAIWVFLWPMFYLMGNTK